MNFFQDFLQAWSWKILFTVAVMAVTYVILVRCCKYAKLGSKFVSRHCKQQPDGDDNQKPCGTEPAEAGKIGLAVVIANEYEGDNKLQGTAKDKERWEKAFRNLQFDVRTSQEVGLNANKEEMLRLIELLSQIQVRDADVPHCRNIAFVFSGHGYEGGIFSQDMEQLDLKLDVFPRLFREKFDTRRKFIFVDACRTTTSDLGQKGFEITASMIPKENLNVIGVGAFVAYATLDRLAASDQDLKDGSHFSKFTTEEIQKNNTISAALDKAIGKVNKLKQPIEYCTRPTYINQLSGELNLYREATRGCISQLKRFIKRWIPWFNTDTGTQGQVDPPPQPTKTSSKPQPPSTSAQDTSPSQHPQSLEEFYSLTPSDVGLRKILSDQPVWDSLAIGLGVPIQHVRAYKSESLGGLLALQHWRNGLSGSSFPSTWRFLFEKVKEEFGKNVAEDLEKKASKEPTWSTGQKK